MSKRPNDHNDDRPSWGSLSAVPVSYYDRKAGCYTGSRLHARLDQQVPRRARRREFSGQMVVIELMQKIESLRERQRLLADDLMSMLERGDPGSDYDCYRLTTKQELAQLQRAWDDFTAQGGVTVDDLKAFLRGEKIGSGNVVKREHLRLVRARKPRIGLGHD
jgi:hypothetical protein